MLCAYSSVFNQWATWLFLHVENHTLFDIEKSNSASFSKDEAKCDYRMTGEATCHDGTDIVCVSVYVHVLLLKDSTSVYGSHAIVHYFTGCEIITIGTLTRIYET